nr:L-ribulose-5-phosphate 3-epimerase [Mycoplasmoides pneumoniae]
MLVIHFKPYNNLKMSFTSTENKHLLGVYEKAINNKFAWKDKIAIAKQASFDFIELSIDESDARLQRLDWSDTEINQLHNELQAQTFCLNSMCLSAHRRFPLGSKNKTTVQQGLTIFEKACVLARKLGIRIIQLAAYDVYYEPHDTETERNFITNMRKVAELAQKYAVTIAFEVMDTPFAGTIVRCLNLIKRIGKANILLYQDIGNLSQFSTAVFDEIALGQDKIVGFHFKDTLPKQFKEVPFGTGTAQFEAALKAIHQYVPTVPILIEMWSKNDPAESTVQNVAQLKQAKQFYEQQWDLALKRVK